MRYGFIKGVLVGGIIASSVGMVMHSDMVSPRTRRRFVRGGRLFLRRSGNVLGNVVDIFR